MPDCNATLRSWAASIAFTSLCLIVLPAPASACTCGSDLYVCSGFDHLRADEAPSLRVPWLVLLRSTVKSDEQGKRKS